MTRKCRSRRLEADRRIALVGAEQDDEAGRTWTLDWMLSPPDDVDVVVRDAALAWSTRMVSPRSRGTCCRHDLHGHHVAGLPLRAARILEGQLHHGVDSSMEPPPASRAATWAPGRLPALLTPCLCLSEPFGVEAELRRQVSPRTWAPLTWQGEAQGRCPAGPPFFWCRCRGLATLRKKSSNVMRTP